MSRRCPWSEERSGGLAGRRRVPLGRARRVPISGTTNLAEPPDRNVIAPDQPAVPIGPGWVAERFAAPVLKFDYARAVRFPLVWESTVFKHLWSPLLPQWPSRLQAISRRLGPKLGPPGLFQPASEQIAQINFAAPRGRLREGCSDEPVDNSPGKPARSDTLLAGNGVHLAAMQEEASDVE